MSRRETAARNLFDPASVLLPCEQESSRPAAAFGVAWMVKRGAVLRDELAVEHAAEEYLREHNGRRNNDKELAGV
jgi:hypothetical protein